MAIPDQLLALAAAFVLSAIIGLERELRSKNAGLRTHTLVGVGSALFMVVSKHGFYDILDANRITLDPSRLASQIVSGIGFIGAGLIFLRADVVRGLTSAAIVWLTAAVGTTAGAGLWPVATAAVVAHYVVAFAFPPLMRQLPRGTLSPFRVRVSYLDGEGVLRTVLARTTDLGFIVDDLDVGPVTAGIVQVSMEVHGKGSLGDLASHLHTLDGVESVQVEGSED